MKLHNSQSKVPYFCLAVPRASKRDVAQGAGNSVPWRLSLVVKSTLLHFLYGKKLKSPVLTGMAQLGIFPQNEEYLVKFPVRAFKRQPIDVSLPLFFPSFPSL